MTQDIRRLIHDTRSTRRYHAEKPVPMSALRDLINNARLMACARNAQTFRYLPIADKDHCDAIFPHLHWAGYLKDWDGPEPDERPSAYILLLNDDETAPADLVSAGLATAAITITATAWQLSTCIIGACDKKDILASLLPDRPQLSLVHVIAIGYGAETINIEPMVNKNDVKYWRSADGTHPVPKKELDDVIIKI